MLIMSYIGITDPHEMLLKVPIQKVRVLILILVCNSENGLAFLMDVYRCLWRLCLSDCYGGHIPICTSLINEFTKTQVIEFCNFNIILHFMIVLSNWLFLVLHLGKYILGKTHILKKKDALQRYSTKITNNPAKIITI